MRTAYLKGPDISHTPMALKNGTVSIYPGMKILFMSGYTSDVIAHRGVLDEGVNFMQKPFSMLDLSIKVREALSEQ
ncbi:MAG: hypothetical protein GJT30_00785 [Geobacter sp.]|nr:hypothetical protein [Geobacter sp.]